MHLSSGSSTVIWNTDHTTTITTTGANSYICSTKQWYKMSWHYPPEQTEWSMAVLWIRNCSTHSEPMTSHVLGGLPSSRRTCCYRLQSWKYDVISWLRIYTFYLKNNPAKFHPNLIWKPQALSEGHRPNKNNKKNKNKVSNNMESVPDPKTS